MADFFSIFWPGNSEKIWQQGVRAAMSISYMVTLTYEKFKYDLTLLARRIGAPTS
jgi:hypothetical protein